MTARGASRAGLALALALAFPAAGGEDGLARGRGLFEEGRRPDGGAPLMALGASGRERPATLLPCASCHGADGRGRPEAGLRPPEIGWRRLTDTAGHDHGGRRHPPFDRASLARALRDGVDPAGNRLDAAMPRYRLTDQDVDALLAYLAALDGSGAQPGVGDDSVAIAIMTRAPRPAAEAAITAHFEAVNAAGGIHGRRIAVVAEPSEAFAAICLCSAATVEPTVLPLLALVGGGAAPSPSRFALIADTSPTDAAWRKILHALGAGNGVVARQDGGLGEADGVVWLGDAAAAPALLAAAAARSPVPLVVLPGTAVAALAAAPPTLAGRLWLALPFAPVAGRNPEAVLAATAAELLAEGLRRAGRALDRDRLIRALEGIDGYRAGPLPPLSFSRARRTALAGAWLVPVEPGRGPMPAEGRWITSE